MRTDTCTEYTVASTSQMGRFETEVLTQPGNLKALTKLSGKWIDRLRERQPMTSMAKPSVRLGRCRYSSNQSRPCRGIF